MRSALFACVIALPAAGLVMADPKKEMVALSGKWQPVSMELGGTKLTKDQLKDRLLVLEDGKYTFTVGKTIDKGTVKIDTKPKTKTMDIVGTEGPNKNKSLLVIYELDGDKLKICYGLDGAKRPTEFKVTGEKVLLVVYEKVKK